VSRNKLLMLLRETMRTKHGRVNKIVACGAVYYPPPRSRRTCACVRACVCVRLMTRADAQGRCRGADEATVPMPRRSRHRRRREVTVPPPSTTPKRLPT